MADKAKPGHLKLIKTQPAKKKKPSAFVALMEDYCKKLDQEIKKIHRI